MAGKNYIITHYPLEKNYLDLFYEKFNDRPEHIIVSNISAKRNYEILNYFRSLKADILYLPTVDDTSRAIFPLYSLLALIFPATKCLEIGIDFSIRKITPKICMLSVYNILSELFLGSIYLLSDWFWVLRNISIKRSSVFDNGIRRTLYMKTNLWLGIKAGGSVAHTAGIIGALLKKGYEVDLAISEAPIAIQRNEKLNLIDVKPTQYFVIPREINHSRHNANFISTISKIWPSRYGFIYQRMSRGSFAGIFLSRLRNIPLILEYNGSEVWLARNWGKPLFMEKFASMLEMVNLRQAHVVVTVSDVLRDEIIKKGIEPERVVSYPNGVNTDIYSPDRFTQKQIAKIKNLLGLSIDTTVITFVGTFGQWHGVEVIAHALRKLAAEKKGWLRKQNVHFLFIGEGVKRKDVEGILALNDLRTTYTLTGLIAQEETPLYLAASDILLCPSVPNADGSPFFGSPTKLFEYLAMGKVVVASNLDQICEILNCCPNIATMSKEKVHGAGNACGILFKPGNSGELIKALVFLIENKEWRMQAGVNARKLALKKYTWERHVEVILDRLGDLLNPPKQSRRPFKILINALHAKSGGGVTYLQNVLQMISEDPDVELHICIHESQLSLLPQNIENMTVHTIISKSTFWVIQLREQIEVPRIAKKIGSDIVFSLANYAPIFAPNSVIMLRNALSVAFIDWRPVKIIYWLLVYLGTVISLIKCRQAIAVSNFAKRSITGGVLKFFGFKVTVIPHGVSQMYSPANDPFPRDDFLLAVSDIYVQKNFVNLLHALALIKKQKPDIVLKIAGRHVDEGYKRRLDNIIVRNGLSENVQFLGHVEPIDLVSLYQRCALFVFPSSVETFGNPLVEAMSCGAPIASSYAAAMPEVLGDAGVYFSSNSYIEMSKIILNVLGDSNLRNDLIRNSLQRSKAFSWQLTALETLQLLKKVAVGDGR